MCKNDNSLWRARLRWLGTTRGRLLGGFCFVILSLLGAGGFVAFSISIENRFPANDEHRALLPASQRAVTRPVVNALSRQIERHVRHKAEAVLLNESIALDEVIARFLDERVPLAERRVYAYRLVHDGSPRAIAALLKVFQAAPP